ncbi:MAG TPA: transketolase family protein [Dissulfurispiraceae bacterium]|nr:transketolase family protein [Dissulfurispiraceae bacterium]
MGGREETKPQTTTDFCGQNVATRDAYGATLAELGAAHEKIVVLDADLSGSTKTAKFAKLFPERFFNMGISEQDMVGTAAGLALSGKIPFASTFAVFETGRAWEQIRQTICYSHLNVKLCASHSGLTVGEDGASHQALEDIALMRVLPGMTVIVPSDGYETRQVIQTAAAFDGPVYVRLGRAKVPACMPQEYRFEIGKGYSFGIGRDVNIVAIGIMLPMALKAKEMLAQSGIDAGVINMVSVKPLDEALLLEAAKTSEFIVTCEEHSVLGGLGGAVAEYLSEQHPVLIKKVGVQDTFGCSGPADELLQLFGLTPESIAETARAGLAQK